MLVFSQYIAKHEFKPLRRFINLNDLLDGARKVMKGLAVETKSPRNIPWFRFFKVRIGKKDGARMIVFVVTGNNKIVPVLIRLKKDKVYGMNMAMNNPQIVREVNKNLDKILVDMKNNAYQEFEF